MQLNECMQVSLQMHSKRAISSIHLYCFCSFKLCNMFLPQDTFIVCSSLDLLLSFPNSSQRSYSLTWCAPCTCILRKTRYPLYHVISGSALVQCRPMPMPLRILSLIFFRQLNPSISNGFPLCSAICLWDCVHLGKGQLHSHTVHCSPTNIHTC